MKETEIKDLIKKGFNTKLLSFELDIPLDIIKKLENEIKASRNIQVQEENKIVEDKETSKEKYKKLIGVYKEELSKEEIPQGESGVIKKLNNRNLLAFAYLKSGLIDEARKELESLIKENSNHTAYRQLIYLEKTQGNIDDAKLWAYDAIEKYPQSIAIREQLLAIAKQENDIQEVISQLNAIKEINPNSKQNIRRLEGREIGD